MYNIYLEQVEGACVQQLWSSDVVSYYGYYLQSVYHPYTVF